MAYSSVALFNGVPAVYALLPPKVKRRRTATNTMAGWFDPLPALPHDSDGDEASTSGTSERLPYADEERARVRKAYRSGKDNGRTGASFKERVIKERVAKRAAESMKGKSKLVKRAAVPEEKENTVSDSDAGGSLSSAPPSPVHKDTTPIALPSSKPKASGFWRAHSSNTPDAASPSALKRKASSISIDEKSASKKPSFTKPRPERLFNAAPPAPKRPTPSLTSLESDPDVQMKNLQPSINALKSLPPKDPSPKNPPPKESAPKELPPKVPQPTDSQPTDSKPTDSKPTDPQPTDPQAMASRSKSASRKDLRARLAQWEAKRAKREARWEAIKDEPMPYDKKLFHFLKLHVFKEKDAVYRCKVCPKAFRNMHYIKMHFGNRHNAVIAHLKDDAEAKAAEKQQRRKNVAVKKGWKGWVEEDLEPQKLILLDKPEVLPERTTRSGRKI